jgi:RNA polymerase sigma factor (sigma-70 family)
VKPLTNAPPPAAASAADQVSALYQEHALGLLRAAVIMLGDRQAAEDVVQDAFLGLYRRWASLSSPDKALAYVRSSVFNGCRTVLRQLTSRRRIALLEPDTESAEARVLLGEEYREVLAALRQLPDRQREAGPDTPARTYSRRHSGWLIPLAAAAVIAMIAVTLVAVRQASAPPSHPTTTPAKSAALPRYYVALTDEAPPASATSVPMVQAGDRRRPAHRQDDRLHPGSAGAGVLPRGRYP